ncbi:ankyrin repeat domain-containing protein [Paludisphaera soli]|uniref:ankyrin repeat domain-containing protein n=1 Tax=Paludisphaera soli TaxID=2712865 RepID=UPI0013ED7878|nr:ankyrin repeat domain-containing protein [Paludisphaera soli]
MEYGEYRYNQWIEAARLGDVAAVAAFLEQGIDVNWEDGAAHTALRRAVRWGRIDVVRLLLDRGADPNVANREGYSATTDAIVAAWSGHGEMLPLLIAAGGRRQTLPDAVWSGDVELACTLLDAGADVDTGKGWTYHGTMIQVACLRGDLAMVDLFLDRGADADEESDIWERPLTTAAKQGHLELVRRLLDYGADIDVVDTYGLSALSHASVRGDRPLYDLLTARGAKIRMFDALNEGDLILFESLLDEKLKELAKDDGHVDHIKRWCGPRLAAFAAEEGNVAVLRMALDRGAAFSHDHDDVSPLALAAKGGHIDAMELLLSRGDDPNRPASEGRTPLALALKEGRDEAVALLRRGGAVV